MKYDLHVHSDLSDGSLNKYEIGQLAKKKKLSVIAFTDHNKYSDVDLEIPVIKAIELDCEDFLSFHLLMYFNEYTDKIDDLVCKYKNEVTNKTIELIKNIKKHHGISISIEKFGYPITKRDIIDYLLEHKYAKSIDEVSRLYTGKRSVSYVKKYSLTYEEVTKLDKKNVSLILAHPTSLNLNPEEEEKFILNLIEKGLDGLEVYNSSKMNREQIMRYLGLAKKYDLFTSSGSDFHSIENNTLGVENNFSKKLILKHI